MPQSNLTLATQAADSDDRTIYDKAKDILNYHRDGTDLAAQVKFAVIKKGLALDQIYFGVF